MPDLDDQLQCFDTVGLVIWPVKIVPEMAYNMLSETLSLYTTTKPT